MSRPHSIRGNSVSSIAAALLVMVGSAAPAQTITDRPELARHFEDAGTQGTMVVHDIGGDRVWVVGAERAREAFPPSSTFKIPNTLIALETKAAGSMDEVFPHDGRPFLVNGEPFLPDACNADITLTVALQNSCIPVYQEIARRIGIDGYRRHLDRFRYGSGAVTEENLTDFWLTGDIKTSAHDQIEFLDRLVTGELGVSEVNVEAVAKALLVEETDHARVYAKTGYVFTSSPSRGWYVGWVERGERVTTFALNLDIIDPEHAGARKAIAIALLKELGILDERRGSPGRSRSLDRVRAEGRCGTGGALFR
jgi:beta-lactamase class D